MANYLIAISGHSGTDWQIKGTAVACYTLATLGKLLSAHYLFGIRVLTTCSTGV